MGQERSGAAFRQAASMKGTPSLSSLTATIRSGFAKRARAYFSESVKKWRASIGAIIAVAKGRSAAPDQQPTRDRQTRPLKRELSSSTWQ